MGRHSGKGGGKSRIIDHDRGWKRFIKGIEAIQGKSYVKVGVLQNDAKGGEQREGGLTNAELAAVHEFGDRRGHIPARSFIRSTFDERKEELLHDAKKIVAEVVFGELSLGEGLGVLGAKLAAEIKKKVTTGSGVPPPNAPSTARAKAMKGKAGASERAKLRSSFVAALREQSKIKDIGGAFAAIGRTAARAERMKRPSMKTLGTSLALAGAAAASRPLVDTGRMIGSVTWAVVMGKVATALKKR